MKRIAWLVISLLLCFAAGAAAENIQPVPAETYEYGDYAYRLLEDGSAEIMSYTGAALELEIPGELVWPCRDLHRRFCIQLCGSLTGITLPDGVTSIGEAGILFLRQPDRRHPPRQCRFHGRESFCGLQQTANHCGFPGSSQAGRGRQRVV